MRKLTHLWIRLRAAPALARFWLRQPMFLVAAVAFAYVCFAVASDLRSAHGAIRWMSGESLLPADLLGVAGRAFRALIHMAVVALLVGGVAINVLPLLRPAAQSPKGLAARQRYAEKVEKLAGLARAKKEAEELDAALRAKASAKAGLAAQDSSAEAGPRPRGARRL